MAQPRAMASTCACSRAAWKSSPCSTSSAPSARIAAFFSRLLPKGTTISAGTPCARAAEAMDWPWLPRVALLGGVLREHLDATAEVTP